MLGALGAVAVHRLDRDRGPAAVALAAGAWGAVWATSSYYVVRSGDFLIINLCPILVAAAAAAFHLVARPGPAGRPPAVVRAAFFPVFAVVLALGFGNAGRLPDWGNALRRGYVGNVDRLLPTMGPDMTALLDRAGVGANDPV